MSTARFSSILTFCAAAALAWGAEAPKGEKGTKPKAEGAKAEGAKAEREDQSGVVVPNNPTPAVVSEPGKAPEPLKAPVAGQGAVPNEEPPAARPILMNKREITAQLQIFLDQQLFSPGMIDGNSGRFLSMALKRWQKAHGLPETGQIDANVPYDKIWPVYTMHTVAKKDYKYIGDLPGKTSEQATKKYLPYSSYLEFVAERYHSSPEFLQKLNPGLKFDGLKEGDQVRVPNVEPFKLEDIPDTGNLPDVEAYKTRRIVINRRDTIFELYDGDKLIASIPIAPGSPAHPTPVGNWRILGISTMPTFRWDAGVLARGVRTSNFYMLPSGPNNPVGVGWIGLNKPGIGIHGTNNPYSIGTWASHGCMRSGNWDIARVSRMCTKGMTVEIQ